MARTETIKSGINEPRETPAQQSRSAPRRRKPFRHYLGRLITYTLLTIGAVVMLFPMIWMVGASLKPSWQILTQPLSFPSEWIHTQAGTTVQGIPLWYHTNASGETQRVFQVGSRRYTTVLDADAITTLISVPADQLTSASPIDFEGTTLNVRQWNNPDGTTSQVVALARDGDNLVIATLDALSGAIRQNALAEVNAGERTNLEIQDFRFQARTMEESNQTVIPLGPESERLVVAPEGAAAAIQIVAAEQIVKAGLRDVGTTELEHYTLVDQPEDVLYVLLNSGPWQPIIDMNSVREYGLALPIEEVPDEVEMRAFEYAFLPVATFTIDGTPVEMVILNETPSRALVIPVEHAESVRLSPLGLLAEPFVERVDGIPVRFRDDYEELGEQYDVAIVGEQRNMALIAPQSTMEQAYDIVPTELERVQEPRLYIENYIDALSRDLGGATFFTFFRNSGLLVILNLGGHFLSVTVVAYGFARLRAPGKNFLFMILLATMMMPFPVLLIPTYEIFQSMGMINTLWPLFIRSFFGNAFLIFLLRQFFTSIPVELEDAARIDGASTMRILWSVMLPLSKPALATMGIFTFWWTWNSFFEPYVYLSSTQNFTVSLGLGFFKSQYTYTYHLLMAASVIAIAPMIAIFFFAQRYFIEGIQLSGLKG